MADTNLAEHVEQTVEAVAQLHAAHRSDATVLDRAVDAVTSTFGRSLSVLLLALTVTGWIVFNVAVAKAGSVAPDPPPFAMLEIASTLAALLLAVLILATQTRNEAPLQSAILSEQKSAKIIALIEELRRDLPSVRDRTDELSDAMIEAPDPQSVLEAIKVKAAPESGRQP